MICDRCSGRGYLDVPVHTAGVVEPTWQKGWCHICNGKGGWYLMPCSDDIYGYEIKRAMNLATAIIENWPRKRFAGCEDEHWAAYDWHADRYVEPAERARGAA